MKIICKKSNLLKGVTIVMKAVSSRTTMPILECILIDASSDVIKLTANDMELGIQTEVEGTIEETGMIAVNAKILSEIIRKLPDNDVTIRSMENNQTSITCEKAKFDIPGREAEEFSYLPKVEKEGSISLSQFVLKEAIRQTIFSISDSETNKLMTGELFEIKENYLRLATLDGHRISIRRIEMEGNFEEKKLVIPGKTLTEISKILSGEIENEVIISYTDNHVVFEFDKTIVVSRLIEGEYFKIDQMLSKDYETKVTINKKEFLNCIDRATLLVKEGDKKPVIIRIEDERMELQINSQMGSMNEEILIEKEGKDLLIGFNPKFLIDALRAIDEEEITIYLMNPKAPCFIKNEEESYLYLILPVNFSTAV
ncbi:DNA polymerase III subunit beta [Suipraeoptans intestinalis]|uniref:DNA polymerase III subunit beta n=1 Tax=Suipraeoptans intestinalis TaxID=2606628 RepID=UPI0023F323B3|nr:DNA polymerase III subunit beta [Suipraeoptans intestinalis]MDD7770586.1 DNA polymerase III subunit beta [Suipraeoptans intestinalis]MDY3121203.1 DNA polymerase III subunit beta [Suipraeoptans intestinalis]